MKDELLDETELYPFAEDEKGVSFLVRLTMTKLLSVQCWKDARLSLVAPGRRRRSPLSTRTSAF